MSSRGAACVANKAPGRSLDGALKPWMTCALALDHPPLLVVSDRWRTAVHTLFNGTPSERHVVRLEERADRAKPELLRRCVAAPEGYKPARTHRQISQEAAIAFAAPAERLRAAGVAPQVASHLLTQCVFGFFAEPETQRLALAPC